MKFTIDTDICPKYGLTKNELLVLMLFRNTSRVAQIIEKLKKSEHLIPSPVDDSLLVSEIGSTAIQKILLESDANVPKEHACKELAIQLRNLFPAGLKPGTNIYWKGNIREITLKLQKFFRIYNEYSPEEILEAASKYIQSFNGDYSRMRVLKYFILKDEKKVGAEGKGYVEEVSELAAFLENAGDTPNILMPDWTSKVI